MHRFDRTSGEIGALATSYLTERLRSEPVELNRGSTGEQLDSTLPSMISEGGNDPTKVFRAFTDAIVPRVISSDSDRFLAFIPAAPTKAAMFFDAVVSASSLNGTSWLEAAGAIHAENQVLRWLADLAGMPSSAGGVFLSGGSAANLSALVVAREVGRHRRPEVARWRFAVSDQAHSSVENTMRIMDVEALVVPTDDGRLTCSALAQAVEADGHPESVAAVVATAGTTNAGIVDDLAGIGEVARQHGWWFHVDAAYGGAALLSPSTRPRFDGIDGADSVVIDPHKWLFAPFDCAALIYREPWLARGVHTQDASYLDSIHEHPGEEWNPTDYAYHLTRRARGLATWFSLSVHGVAQYRQAVEAALDITRRAAERIRELPHLELVREPELSVVLFQRTGWGHDDYRRWSDDLLDRQVAFVLPSKWRGEPVGRLAFVHPGTTMETVDDILAATA